MKARCGTLVVIPGGLGDVVQLRDVLARFVDASPEPVDLLTAHALVDLARSWGIFRDVIPLDAGRLYRGGVVARARLMADMVRRLRARSYRAALVLKAHPGFTFMAWAAGIPTRFGFRRGPAPFLTESVDLDPTMHRVERARRLAGLLLGRDLHVEDLDPERGAPSPESDLRIAFAPGGARNDKEEMPSRRWPAERYAEAAGLLAAHHPEARLFVLGAGDDAPACAEVMEALPPTRSENLCDAVPVTDLGSRLASMDLLLTHDSGLLHVAEGAGCPTVAVFGPTNPGVVSRRGARTTCLWRPGGSEACHDEASGEVRCRYAPCCIQRVPVADVVLAAEALLGGAPEGPPALR